MRKRSETFTLYRIFGKAADLLYIGKSIHQLTRLRTHIRSAPFADDIVTIRVENFPDHAALMAAERAAIKLEKPRFNTVHTLKTTTGLAREHGINPALLQSRVKRGVPVENLFAKSGWRPRDEIEAMIFAADLTHGIEPKIVCGRVRRGWPIEDALATPVGPGKGPPPDWGPIADLIGIHRTVVRSRLENGWSLDLALTASLGHRLKQPRPRPRRDVKHRTPGLTATALANGVKPETAKARIKRGWPREKALTTPRLLTWSRSL